MRLRSDGAIGIDYVELTHMLPIDFFGVDAGRKYFLYRGTKWGWGGVGWGLGGGGMSLL